MEPFLGSRTIYGAIKDVLMGYEMTRLGMWPMAKRNETATAQLKVRLREPLRARIEAAAKRSGHSLNTEIVGRLERSITDDDYGLAIFGSEEIFTVVTALAQVIRAHEIDSGKKIREDFGIYFKAIETISRFLQVAPTMLASGEYPGGIRDVVDVNVSQMIQTLAAFNATREPPDA
jgi:hypothetical protein